MQRSLRRQVPDWVGFTGAVAALVSVALLAGCPGTLDPDLAKMATGAGGSGDTGTGGTVATNCTGNNDGATIIMNTCAQTYCHDAGGASACGGLDLTMDANLSSRLVGVTTVGTAGNGSLCVGNSEPYLVAGSNPATGLLLDKLKSTPPCGARMPYTGNALTTTQVTCLTQWATTLTAP
ncbi:MAG TPA: hypothetical protein VHO06_23260 [Polyangia bacterium]|nr:hypothetical protein [Polyangia bacterium]